MPEIRKSSSFIAKNIPVFLGIAILAALIWGLYFLATNVSKWFSTLENVVAISIVTASVAAIASTAGIIISKNYEHKREIRKEHNNKKIPVYEELISFMSKVQFAEKIGEKAPTKQETIKFFAKFIPKFIIWASEDVIKSYTQFRGIANKNEQNPGVDTLFKYEEILQSIRKDLGHKDNKIKRGDILALFINDIDKHL